MMNQYQITAWAAFRGTSIWQKYAVTARDLPDAFEQVVHFMAGGFYADMARTRWIIPERILISRWE